MIAKIHKNNTSRTIDFNSVFYKEILQGTHYIIILPRNMTGKYCAVSKKSKCGGINVSD